MKKILSFLIIGILILSSIGAIATREEKNSNHEPLKSDIFILARGGFGIRIFVHNYDTTPYEQPGTIEVIIDAPLMLIGARSNLSMPIPIQPDETAMARTGLVLGFGKCLLTINIDIDNDGDVDTYSTAEAIIFGPIVFQGTIPIPSPLSNQ
jgi:hypothetical protein